MRWAACSSLSLFCTSRRATAVLKRRLPGLQRELDLAPRLVGLAVCGQRKSSIDRIPELGHGISQILPLFGSAVSNRHLLLLTSGIVQV